MKSVINRIVFLNILLFFSVGADAQKKRSNTPHAPGEDIYKHYVGTIGKKKIALDLRYGYQGASNYGGSKYYTLGKDDRVLFYIAEPETFEHGVPMTAREDEGYIGVPKRNENSSQPKWEFVIKGDKLTGTKKSGDGGKGESIDLKEDYSQSVPLELRYMKNFSQKIMPGRNKPLAISSVLYVIPSETADEATSTLVNKSLLDLLGIKDFNDSTGNGPSDVYNYRFFATCEKVIDSVSDDEIPDNPYTQHTTVLPVYNDKGLLVLKKDEKTDFDNGLKSQMQFSYIDVRNKKTWSSAEVLNVNAPKLSEILEATVRSMFNISADKKFSEFIAEGKMPVSEFFYPANEGVYFCYPNQLRASFYDNDSRVYSEDFEVYVSYEKLGDIVTEGFRNRIGG